MRLRKKTIAVTTAAFVIAGTTAALAFWTTGGSGSGSTSTASATGDVTLEATVSGGPLVPGGSQNIAITATNPNNAAVTLGDISFVVHTSNEPDCAPSNFNIDSVVGGLVPANAGNGVVPAAALPGAVLEFIDTGENQDLCKGVDVTFTMTAAAPAVA